MRSLIVFACLALGAAGLIGGLLDRGTSAASKQPDAKASLAATQASGGARVVEASSSVT